MTAASGMKKAIGDIVGEDLSVVVFLRHLGSFIQLIHRNYFNNFCKDDPFVGPM